MATSTGKTIGLILLIIIILLLALRMTPLILAPFGIFPSVFHILRMPEVNCINFGHHYLFNIPFFSMLLSLAFLVLWILVITWVYRDAERRGMNGLLWSLLVFIGNLIGLVVYLIVRTENLSVQKEIQKPLSCPNCQKTVSPGFVFCPNCGARLHAVCPKCKKPVESSWQICPHCGEKLDK